MDSNTTNPLAKHFRQPAIYIKLPSRGAHWPEDAIRMPANGEIAIYPMTTKDEITLKTPDALMNGAGVVSVIQSCCPDILDAWRMPSIDVDSVIIAIRIASFGHEMQFNSKCPSCDNIDDYGVDLRTVLESLRMPDYTTPVELDTLKVKLYPQPYFSLNQSNQAQFEEQKLMQAIENTSMDETVRSVEIANQMEKIIAIGVQTLADSTEYIELPDGTKVRDKVFLKEFYTNSSAAVTNAVQERISNINTEGAVKPMHVNCSECQKPFDIQITFDYSAFFG